MIELFHTMFNAKRDKAINRQLCSTRIYVVVDTHLIAKQLLYTIL